MSPTVPVALALTLLAGGAAGLAVSSPVLPTGEFTAARVSSHAQGLTAGTRGRWQGDSSNSNLKMFALRRSAGLAPQQCRLSFGRMLEPVGAAGACGDLSSVSRKSNAAQSVSVREVSSRGAGATLAMNAGGGGGGGGPPVGGYPPPEHLHGIFAVYKPQGFSSADVVQKIKNVLTKGVRDEIQAKLALENTASPTDAIGVDGGVVVDAGQVEGKGAAGRETSGEAVIAAEASASVGAGAGAGGPNGGGGPSKKKRKGAQRRQKGPKVKVGHGGTLDPMATGVLVIGVGRGCRELGNFLKGGKGYRAEGLLGHETNTQDAEGEATLHGDWEHVTEEAVDGALGQFIGDIMQVPPMFSALHKDGKRLYQLAREGVTVERDARPVTVYSLRQTSPPPALPLVGLELECGGGFYVRTLIEDLARALGSRAHMTALERTKQGPFELEHALARDDWEYHRLCKHLNDTQERMDPPSGRRGCCGIGCSSASSG